MMHFVTVLALATIALLLSRVTTHSAGAALCDAYAKESAAKALGVRAFACGYDLKEARWATDRRSHASWCRANPDKTVADEAAQRRAEVNLCQTCRVYADMAVEAAARNKKLKCGLTGPSWNESKSDHFAWCMALRDDESTGEVAAAASQDIATKVETMIRQETVDRKRQIVKCKIDASVVRDARP